MAFQDMNGEVFVPDVEGWLNTLNDYANSAINSADNVAQGLLGFNAESYQPNVNFDSVTTNVGTGTVSKPTLPVVPTTHRSPPAPPSIIYPTLQDIGAIPTFNEPDPAINLPTVPDPLSANIPVKDFIINTDFDYPIAPNDPLPDVPTLLSLNIPTALALDIPVFSLDFPTTNSLIVPGVTFSFTEDLYSSPLLTKIKDELISRVSGGTGLSPEVEEAIWNRGRDREQRASLLAENTLLIDRASQGFSRPSGATQAALALIVQETQSKIIELSREIMIKQAELEQENIKTSIQQAISLEDLLIKEHQQIVQRSFEVAKYIQDIAIEIFKIQVSVFQSEVEAYKAFATAYSARVQAELSKIEILKAQIEAEKLKGEINEQNIRIYLARLEGVKTNVEIYKTLIETISEKLKAENLKLETYKTDITAYTALVGAKAAEYGMYADQMKGELAKVDIFDAKVKAFATRIQAYSATADVVIKKAELVVDIEELKIKEFEAEIDSFIKQVQADQLIYQSAVDLYKGETQMYLADVEAVKASSELALKSAENVIIQNKYKADLGISNAQITLESLKSAYTAMLNSRIAAGSIYQSIGSSALSAINVSASLSGGISFSGNENRNYAL